MAAHLKRGLAYRQRARARGGAARPAAGLGTRSHRPRASSNGRATSTSTWAATPGRPSASSRALALDDRQAEVLLQARGGPLPRGPRRRRRSSRCAAPSRWRPALAEAALPARPEPARCSAGSTRRSRRSTAAARLSPGLLAVREARADVLPGARRDGARGRRTGRAGRARARARRNAPWRSAPPTRGPAATTPRCWRWAAPPNAFPTRAPRLHGARRRVAAGRREPATRVALDKALAALTRAAALDDATGETLTLLGQARAAGRRSDRRRARSARAAVRACRCRAEAYPRARRCARAARPAGRGARRARAITRRSPPARRRPARWRRASATLSMRVGDPHGAAYWYETAIAELAALGGRCSSAAEADVEPRRDRDRARRDRRAGPGARARHTPACGRSSATLDAAGWRGNARRPAGARVTWPRRTRARWRWPPAARAAPISFGEPLARDAELARRRRRPVAAAVEAPRARSAASKARRAASSDGRRGVRRRRAPDSARRRRARPGRVPARAAAMAATTFCSSRALPGQSCAASAATSDGARRARGAGALQQSAARSDRRARRCRRAARAAAAPRSRTTSRRKRRSARKRPAATSSRSGRLVAATSAHVDRRAVVLAERGAPPLPAAPAAAWPARAATAPATSSRKSVPPCASSNRPRRSTAAPVNAPRDVAEELGVDEFVGERGAVDGHERRRAAGSAACSGARDQFLADAALAFDEHRHKGDAAARGISARKRTMAALTPTSPYGSVARRAARRAGPISRHERRERCRRRRPPATRIAVRGAVVVRTTRAAPPGRRRRRPARRL